MKQLTLILLLLTGLSLLAATTFTPRSLLFADSYMLRARGCDASYWNPALLNKDDHDIWIPALNTGIFVGNNAIDLNLYEYIMARDYLDAEAKQHILNAIGDRLAFDLGGNIGLFGFTMGNVALSSTVHLGTRAAIDGDYFKLLLEGNGDGSEVFEFSSQDTYLQAQSYLDLTVGVGDIRLPLPKIIPDIKFGFSGSILGGIGDLHTDEFSGLFSSNLDGLTVHQDARALAGAGGGGFKGMIGLHSEPIKHLHAGLTLDNIFGFIKWGLIREDFRFHFAADSLYALDVINMMDGEITDLEGELYELSYSQNKAEPYVTKLPLELRAALLFRSNQISVSADYVKGFGNSAAVSTDGRLSFGAEITPVPFLPIHIGYNMGNSTYPWRVSYGLGLNLKFIEFGLGIQSIESLIPGPDSKGIAVATYFNLRL